MVLPNDLRENYFLEGSVIGIGDDKLLLLCLGFRRQFNQGQCIANDLGHSLSRLGCQCLKVCCGLSRQIDIQPSSLRPDRR